MVLLLLVDFGPDEIRKMKELAMIQGGKVAVRCLGLVLWALLFGFTASPAIALSMASTEVASAFHGTSRSPSLAGGFPKVTALGNSFWPTTPGTDVTADASRKVGLDDGRIKAIGAPVGTAVALRGTHRLDLFFGDAQIHQSGAEPAWLLLFGAMLVGLGVVVRRRMRGAAKHNA